MERPGWGGAAGGHGMIVLSGAVSRVFTGWSRADVNTHHRCRPQGGGDVSAWQGTGWAAQRERPAPNSAPWLEGVAVVLSSAALVLALPIDSRNRLRQVHKQLVLRIFLLRETWRLVCQSKGHTSRESPIWSIWIQRPKFWTFPTLQAQLLVVLLLFLLLCIILLCGDLPLQTSLWIDVCLLLCGLMVVGVWVPVVTLCRVVAGWFLMMFALLLYPHQQAPDLPVGRGESCCFVEVCQRCSKLPGGRQRKWTKEL